MRYKVKHKGKFIEIRSENAALTYQLQQKALVDWIRAHSPVEKTLDYGCGKLRYSKELRAISDTLMLVDSKIQLERFQIIYGQYTTIKDHARSKWNDVNTLTIDEFRSQKSKYDLILCANVLSAIPSKKHIKETLNLLRQSMSRNSKCLFVNQHINSKFKERISSESSIQHAYGWLLKSYRGYSYYGIFNKSVMEMILPRAGLKISKIWINGQSTFVECSIA